MPYQREVRLGLVLYGGVSLAVYENGVAQELHRAIRGDGVYGLLKELIDSDIVVDIISGTSAGGVNGIMLAAALAKKQAFAPSADLWRNQADIQELLRKEEDPATTSVLNSDYYQQKLEECFGQKLVADPTAPEIDELDLFITGTDANGDISTVYDDQGHAIDVKNHRRLFKLSVRSNSRKNDLCDARASDLARLARLTSCFPVAFAPVGIGDADQSFYRWGKMHRPAVYLDGGILNNKPFTSTIEAIATRTATRDVDRFLIYVEPDPEIFQEPANGVAPHSPFVLEAATSSLLGIPRYQSIAADLEAIEAHNEQASRIAAIFASIGEAPQCDAGALAKASVLPETEPSASAAYLACRSIQLRDAVIEQILNDRGKGRGFICNPAERRAGRILVESFDNWPGDARPALEKYDVFFRMRRAMHLSDTLMRRVKAQRTLPSTQIWEVVNHYFKLYEMTRWAMEQWLEHWDYPWRDLSDAHPQLDTLPPAKQRSILAAIAEDIWGKVEARVDLLLQAAIEVPLTPSPAAREAFYLDLKTFLKSPAASNRANLLQRIDDVLKNALTSAQGEVGTLLRNEFCRFTEVDRQLFPVRMGSGFASTDMVRVVRFSPRDAQRGLSVGEPSAKVCGTALSAFGGFFKKSWRANDIMIGRFDAVCQLIECLLTKERLALLPAGRTVALDQFSKWFPGIAAADAVSLANTINAYLAAPEAATQATWDAMIDAIVMACHNSIEPEEWPRVVASAVEQEHQWGRYRTNTKAPPAPFDTANLAWNRAGSKPDEVLVSVAAEALAAGRIPRFKPGSIAGRPFLDELPGTVLQELGTLAGIRVGKSLPDSFTNPTLRKKVVSNAFYKWTFDRILPVSYRWARVRRTQPESVVVFNTAIPTFCITVLLVNIALVMLGAQLSWRAWAILWVAPVILLAVWGKWFRR